MIDHVDKRMKKDPKRIFIPLKLCVPLSVILEKINCCVNHNLILVIQVVLNFFFLRLLCRARELRASGLQTP